MKNKTTILLLLLSGTLVLSSCFTSRSKYGCPSTAYVKAPARHI